MSLHTVTLACLINLRVDPWACVHNSDVSELSTATLAGHPSPTQSQALEPHLSWDIRIPPSACNPTVTQSGHQFYLSMWTVV